MRRVLFEPNELYSVSDRLDYIEIDSVSVYSVSDRLMNMSPRSSPRGWAKTGHEVAPEIEPIHQSAYRLNGWRQNQTNLSGRSEEKK